MHLRHDKSNVAIMIPLYWKQESRKKAHECEKQNEKQTMNIGEFIVMYRTAMNTRTPMKNTRNHRQQQRNGRLSHRVAANIPFLWAE
jgi:response regulator RpfG family c-di-GMP phosphodiesterase